MTITIADDGIVTIDRRDRERTTYKVPPKDAQTLQMIMHGTLAKLIHDAGGERNDRCLGSDIYVLTIHETGGKKE